MEPAFTARNLNVCNICQKKLSSKQNLRQHLNIHSGDKPYCCTYPGCDSSYKHASQLSSHKIIHSKNDENQTLLIDDFKHFIKLVILALDTEKKLPIKVPSRPLKRESVSLPPITEQKDFTKLPSLFEDLDLTK
jgi:uncharacterized Zn-finger protein